MACIPKIWKTWDVISDCTSHGFKESYRTFFDARAGMNRIDEHGCGTGCQGPNHHWIEDPDGRVYKTTDTTERCDICQFIHNYYTPYTGYTGYTDCVGV